MRLPNVQTQTVATSAAVRLAFDAKSKVLSCFYDENGPVCGYAWRLLRSEEVGRSWGLSSQSTISIAVLGDSALTPLTSSANVFGDNFRASSGLTPRLGISGAGGKVLLSWPTNAPRCHLESATELTAPICWKSPPEIPGVVSTNFTVTNVVSSGNRFYRLSR